MIKARRTTKTGVVFLLTVITTTTLLAIYNQTVPPSHQVISIDEDDAPNFDYGHYDAANWRNLSKDKIQSLSKLGRILYLDEELPELIQTAKQFKILVWKYGSTINDRHIKRYSSENHDPFEYCSVKNCILTYDGDQLANADIVLIHLHRTTGTKDLPPNDKRSPNQIWAFMTDESPFHTFLHTKENKFIEYNGIFNWSMTYRMDSDIPVPYGRTILRPHEDPSKEFDLYKWFLSKRHDVLVAIMGSNCGSKNHRWEYVKQLQNHMSVDVYGACGTLKCMGHFRMDCPDINRYMFYLSFENSNCDEYITEKLWWNAYAKNAIPIVMGAPKDNYTSLLPPNSFINVDDFATPRDLATYLNYLFNTPSEFRRFFRWRKHFQVLNEHGYFQSLSYHYCRVCEAMNYNKKQPKVYKDLQKFWSVDSNCYPAWDKIYD